LKGRATKKYGTNAEGYSGGLAWGFPLVGPGGKAIVRGSFPREADDILLIQL